MKEDETAGRHHQFNAYELGQTLEDGEGQGSLACLDHMDHVCPWITKGWTRLGNLAVAFNFILMTVGYMLDCIFWLISGC